MAAGFGLATAAAGVGLATAAVAAVWRAGVAAGAAGFFGLAGDVLAEATLRGDTALGRGVRSSTDR